MFEPPEGSGARSFDARCPHDRISLGNPAGVKALEEASPEK